jgi:hypothetical protein
MTRKSPTIKIPRRKWTDAEDMFLADTMGVPVRIIAELLGRTESGVRGRRGTQKLTPERRDQAKTTIMRQRLLDRKIAAALKAGGLEPTPEPMATKAAACKAAEEHILSFMREPVPEEEQIEMDFTPPPIVDVDLSHLEERVYAAQVPLDANAEVLLAALMHRYDMRPSVARQWLAEIDMRCGNPYE